MASFDAEEAVLIAGIIVLIILFTGDPDIHDAVINYLMKQ